MIGFAAETENLIENAKAKLARKGCDWIVANDVSPATGVMGGDRNTVHLLTGETARRPSNSWPVMTKEQVAAELVARIAEPGGEPIVSVTVKVDIRQLPHGEGLALPAYQSARRRRARPAGGGARGCAARSCARKIRAGADRADDRAAARL